MKDPHRHIRILSLGLLFLLLAVTVACNMVDRTGTRVALTPEQLRLEKINTIDSFSLRTVLNPDSMEGWEQLSGLSADAWMLIDDSTGYVICQRYANEPRFMASLT